MTYASWERGFSSLKGFCLFQVYSLPVSCQRASWRCQGRSSRGPKRERWRGPASACAAVAITAHAATSRGHRHFIMFLSGDSDDGGAESNLVLVGLDCHVGHSTTPNDDAFVRHGGSRGAEHLHRRAVEDIGDPPCIQVCVI